MVRAVGFLSLLLVSISLAQYVPLELDYTVQLPADSGSWDIMPLPNGYFIWVQAVTASDPEQTRLFWGTAGGTTFDSTDIACGSPMKASAFIPEGGAPAVYLASRFAADTTDSTIFRGYDLQSGQPVSPLIYLTNWSSEYYTWTDWRLVAAAAVPPPPQTTNRILAVVASECHHVQNVIGIAYNATYQQPIYFVNSLASDSSHFASPDACDFADWTVFGEDVYLMTSSRQHTLINHDERWTHFVGQRSTEYYSYGWDLLSYETLGRIPRECIPYPVACVYDSIAGFPRVFTRVADTCGSSDSSWAMYHWYDMRWTTPELYDFWCAADCVPGNSCEEFLCYDLERRVFDVLDAATGEWYGVTDTLSFDSSDARIIGRYEESFRRLVVRDGNQLNIYRFGEYNAADRSSTVIPDEFTLAVYPNPFNPSTHIDYYVPATSRVTLSVFNLMGEIVAVLADDFQTAGTHAVSFDGSSFSSGIYFCRLNSGNFVQTQKMVLLK
jgi:hypothetical protein